MTIDILTRSVSRGVFRAKQLSPTALACIGATGVLVTAVLASKATLRLSETLDAAQEGVNLVREKQYDSVGERSKDLSYAYLRAGVLLGRLYLPSAVSAGVSIAAILGGHRVMLRRTASMAAAYTALDAGFREYRKRAEFLVGEERVDQLAYDRSDQETVVDDIGETVETHRLKPNPSGYARFFDESCPGWTKDPAHNLAYLRSMEDVANRKLSRRGYVYLNDVYDLLGMEQTAPGNVVGWVLHNGGQNYIDFGLYNAEDAQKRKFVNGLERSVLLEFNVDGVISDLRR